MIAFLLLVLIPFILALGVQVLLRVALGFVLMYLMLFIIALISDWKTKRAKKKEEQKVDNDSNV